MYEVVLSTEAQQIYTSADQALAKKIARCLEQLEQTPRLHPNIKPLTAVCSFKRDSSSSEQTSYASG